ncbi:FecCD family ABC transporter permease [Streptococcus iniae]|uniref:FecCD family ABC transporter permease n=1 Tax=Streptococcus iniae TaxID=1346 RepID=UPI002B302DC5|nr:iron ABC transporter permease [Streptococcus iniae]WNZ89515.1 iron ABC transporter permease [Streptococcus iniae]WNZ91148.1 iron ABC transporter permease [Streptococcus iniae]WNZ95279.1 iron ABC transporter permease [Streptococcus iniae]WNZ95631.1 iron ABC transporter permease [Streptococcus iniae]
MIPQKTKVIASLLLALVLLILVSLAIGDSNFSIKPLLELLLGKENPSLIFIITKIRLPRILVALFGGASLALAGILLQTLTKNPLADSGILGINAGAGIVMTLVISFFAVENPLIIKLLPFLATLGGAVTVSLVYFFSVSKTGKLNPVTLIIIGVSISMMLSSLMVAIVGNINKYKVDYVINWLSGRITGDDWPTLVATLPLLIILAGLTYYRAYTLNILTLSEESARSLGIRLEKERLITLGLATGLAAASVALIGNITFIGLISGHLSRRLVGNDHRIALPVSAILGMLILLSADTIGRVFLVGSNIPTGVIVSIIGAPYFLYLMRKIKS